MISNFWQRPKNLTWLKYRILGKKVTEMFGQHLFMVIEIQRKDEKFWTNVEASIRNVTRIMPRSWAIIKFF